MIQKATWIIPGILVTLLLGLLWAMPAFAAEAGVISFLDSEGDEDEISFVSLNGDAAKGGFWIQVTDSDLDPVVSVSITNDTGTAAAPLFEPFLVDALVGGGFILSIGTDDGFSDETGYTWHDVQDSTNDGVVDNRDFTAWSYATPNAADVGDVTQVEDAIFEYDRSNGKLGFTPGTSNLTHEIRYKVKKTTILGARNGSNQTATFEPDIDTAGNPQRVVNTDLDEGLTVTALQAATSPDTSRIDSDGNLTWMEFLGSRIPDLGTRAIAADPNTDGNSTENDAGDAPVVAVETEVKALINAYNKDDSGKALAVTVEATSVRHVGLSEDPPTVPDDSRQINSIDVVIGNTDAAAADIDEDTVCVGNIRNDTELPADTDLACTGTTYYEESVVVVEVAYVGSASTVYDRKGEEDDVGRVMVDSSGATSAISVLLKETGSATGIFGAEVVICNADDCDTSQAGEESVADGTGTIMIPVEEAGDTITIAYLDGSPRGTRRASISLDPSGPSFSGMSPASGTAGREDEPTVSFEVVDGESGLTDDEDVEDSIYVVAGLYDLDQDESSDSVVYVRDDLDSDEVTNGFEASVTLDEGDQERQRYEITIGWTQATGASTRSVGGPWPLTWPATSASATRTATPFAIWTH